MQIRFLVFKYLHLQVRNIVEILLLPFFWAMFYSESYYSIFNRYWDRFDRVIKKRTYMALLSPQIAIGLMIISIGIAVSFDIKIDLFKSKE